MPPLALETPDTAAWAGHGPMSGSRRFARPAPGRPGGDSCPPIPAPGRKLRGSLPKFLIVSDFREPIRFQRVFLEKVWGGRALEKLGMELPPDQPIGETWEIVDREGENSVVASGTHVGRTLGELVQKHPGPLLGLAKPNRRGRFPLLVKFIDAAQDLSVQVHPDDASAARVGNGAEGKTEAWYVLDADPKATLYLGPEEGVEPEVLASALGTADMVPLLKNYRARPGEAIGVPGGTIHAIGAGVTLLEVQQNSDTTFRIYDWGRMGLDGEPRETHLKEARQVAVLNKRAPAPVSPRWRKEGPGVQRADLVLSPYFRMERWSQEREHRLRSDHQFRIVAVVEGSGALAPKNGREQSVDPGDVVLLPADCDEVTLLPGPNGLGWLRLDANC